MPPFFVWTRANAESTTKHGVTMEDAEFVVLSTSGTKIGHTLYRVRGLTEGSEYIEGIYRYVDEESPIDWSEVDLLEIGEGRGILIFHARPLTEREKRRLNRRRT